MAQLQCMDACLDTLSIEMYQMNVRVGHIARRQMTMGGFAPEATPSPPSFDSDSDDDDGDDDDASEDNDDDDNDASKDDDDGDANSTDEMST